MQFLQNKSQIKKFSPDNKFSNLNDITEKPVLSAAGAAKYQESVWWISSDSEEADCLWDLSLKIIIANKKKNPQAFRHSWMVSQKAAGSTWTYTVLY